ncbi:MAG: Omp28-related outer membrane protein [Bacteroidota bacterium]
MKKIFLLLLALLVGTITGQSQEVPETQQIVISKLGATWCTNCGRDAWDQFDKVHQDLDGKAVILSLHPSPTSKLHSQAALDFTNNLPQAWGQPLFYVNRTKHNTNSIVQEAEVAATNSTEAAPLANVGITATINGDKLEVKAKAKFFQEGNGDYYLSLLIVEEDVIEDQASRGADVPHKKILRSSLLGNTFGQSISTGTVAANQEFDFTDSQTIPADWISENLEVAAIIWKKEGDNYEFVNANSVDASFATSVNFLAANGFELNVAPTLFRTNAVISLVAPDDFANGNLTLHNATGQVVNNLFSGTLSAGMHTFDLQRANLPSGIYFLKLANDKGVLSRKLVVE